MKTWAVTFMNERTRKLNVDRFTCENEAQAEHDFFECYRHENYLILSVVPLPERE
jgi:hypothetical protein